MVRDVSARSTRNTRETVLGRRDWDGGLRSGRASVAHVRHATSPSGRPRLEHFDDLVQYAGGGQAAGGQDASKPQPYPNPCSPYANPNPTLQWIPVCANVAFIAINSVQIAIILRERQDITLEPHEKAVYEAVFEAAHLSKRQVIHMYILYMCVCVRGG